MMTLDGGWIQEFLSQIGEVLEKMARALFKSLGGLLALQERIAEKWAAAHPATAPASGGDAGRG